MVKLSIGLKHKMPLHRCAIAILKNEADNKYNNQAVITKLCKWFLNVGDVKKKKTRKKNYKNEKKGSQTNKYVFII